MSPERAKSVMQITYSAPRSFPRPHVLAVTTIRINPKGDLAASQGTGDPSMQLSFKVIVQ